MSAYDGFDTMPIGGRWRAGSSGRSKADTDPWSGDTLTEIPLADAGDLDDAYAAAADAQREWAARPPAARAGVMRAAAESWPPAATRSSAGSCARGAGPWPSRR